MSTGRCVATVLGRAALAAAVVGTGLAALPQSASAYTKDTVDYYNDSPWFSFQKNYSSPLNSTLQAWLSVGGVRYRVTQRAGSGNGTTNQCTSNAGWLPDGIYSNNDSDSRSWFSFYNKTSGNAVVMGWVWSLGDKNCGTGKYRTELFIHSQGTSGWSDSNYASAGCIKINQTDRANLASMYRSAYHTASGFLSVG